MFIVFLKFSGNKSKASDLMEGHKSWIKSGIDSGMFLMVGSLQPNQGGCILSNISEKTSLEDYLRQDPFVIEDVVTAEVLEVTPSMASEKLRFLMEGQ